MPTTTRLSLRYPALSDDADVPDDLQKLASDIDKAAIWGKGLLAARPTSTVGSPGIDGRFYYATDSQHVYLDLGTSWLDLGPVGLGADSITAFHIAANAVGLSELADGAVDTAAIVDLAVTTGKINDLAVTAAKIASALKPSGGAGAGTEALRALGTGAGEAAAGNDSRLSDDRKPSSTWIPLVVVSALRTNGQTFALPGAPIAGTYIIEWGGGELQTSGQGSGGGITNNKTSGTSRFSDTGASGGPVLKTASLALSEVVTFTVAVSGFGTGIADCWAKMTRTA